ncbi:hypothetical protein PG993_003075 [Apiospora rasikravindrae]|uniref:Uncharacterized protein n=1 Tax=Apiospora rasikravindrae TaxID=990691 RepID=A0ABR1TYC7_9PEZI
MGEKARSLEEHACSQSRQSDVSNGSEKPGAATEPLSLEDDLLLQLRYLLAFVDEYLGGQLRRYEDARAGRLRTIRYQDLWMLYKPGDLTYTPSRRKVDVFNREIPRSVRTKRSELAGAWVGRNMLQEIESDEEEQKPVIVGTGTPQAYRITAVLGGLPIESPKRNSARAIELYHPLRVVRYYVDFNGMRYVSVSDPITFNPYDGEREILSLLSYPLTYAPDPENPLGRVRPVVIDLKLAYTTFPELQPQASLPDAEGYLNIDTKDRQIHAEMESEFAGGDRPFGAVTHIDWYQGHQQRLTEKATTDLNDNLSCYPSVSLDTPDAIEKLTDAMSRDDYLCLLPGTVYAYALRSRKWVFLRILEYYQGILFLTTNRVGSFDDAFRSRLHLTLYYPKLDRKQTVAIWNVNLRRIDDLNKNRLEYGEQPIEVQKDKILKFAKREWEKLSWNGRQIRNAFQTAVALAEFDAKKANDAAKKRTNEEEQHQPQPFVRPVITKKHFETIAETSMQFDEYLYLAHGRSDESNNAKRDQVRWDYELRDSNRIQQQQHLKRLGGNRNFSSDSSSDNDASSSDSDGGTKTVSHFSADSSDRKARSDSGSSSSSDSDEKVKGRSKKSKRGKGKSKVDKGRKHQSKKGKN